MLESLDRGDQPLSNMTKRVVRILTPSAPLQVLGGITLSDSKKAEALRLSFSW